MKRRWRKWMRWAWMLPVAELLVAALVAGPLLVDEYHMGQLLRDPSWMRTMSHLSLQTPNALAGPSKQNWIDRTADKLPGRTQSVVLANIPGAAVDAMIAAVRHKRTVGPTMTFPFDRWAWAAMLYPIFALPFWWILGRSADAAQSMRTTGPKRLRWWDLAVTLSVAIVGITACADYWIAATPADKASPDFVWVVRALTAWAIVCTAASVIWLQQWQRRRRVDLAGSA